MQPPDAAPMRAGEGPVDQRPSKLMVNTKYRLASFSKRSRTGLMHLERSSALRPCSVHRSAYASCIAARNSRQEFLRAMRSSSLALIQTTGEDDPIEQVEARSRPSAASPTTTFQLARRHVEFYSQIPE